MQCNHCGKIVTGNIPGGVARCLYCGKLITEGKETTHPENSATLKHSYQTPYGKTLAQFQKSGNWVAVSCLAVPETSKAAALQIVSNLVAAWREIDHPLITKAHSFDEKNLRCTWVLPKVENAVPLSLLAQPLQVDIMGLIRGLATQLTYLHNAGFAAFDLSPSVIFLPKTGGQPIFVPTPWLASQALWNPEALRTMPFVAPELEKGSQFYPDPVRADMYSLGALVWFLLTGNDRRQFPSKMPSEHSAQLKKWDEFIDGCCRSNPARRFESVAIALKSLENTTKTSEPIPKPGEYQLQVVRKNLPPQKYEPVTSRASTRVAFFSRIPEFKNRKAIFLCSIILFTVVLMAAFLRIDSLALQFPELGTLLTPYRRGFGDTILQYMDRTYENASWKKLKEASSLSQLAEVTESHNVSDLARITGWDEDNYYVLAESGRVFHCRSGHWTSSIKPEKARNPSVRLLNSQTLIIAGSYGVDHLYQLSPTGLVDFGKLGFQQTAKREITAIANDLLFCFSPNHPSLNEEGTNKISLGKMTAIPEDKFKESFVHNADNTPLKEYPTRGIRNTRTPSKGKAFGISGKDAHADFTHDTKIVYFKDGIWYTVDDLPERYWKRTYGFGDVWYEVNSDKLLSLILVGDDGYVYSHAIGGLKAEMPVSRPQENTSLDLIKVWAASSQKFWVMDKSGTVWERSGTDWRVVVRGMYREDVDFVDAWVSPRGSVFAITKKHVYRLD